MKIKVRSLIFFLYFCDMQVWKWFSQFEQTYGDLTSMLKACVLAFLLNYFCMHLVTVKAVCVCVCVCARAHARANVVYRIVFKKYSL